MTDAADQTPGYLSQELLQGPGILLQTVTTGVGNDQLRISSTSGMYSGDDNPVISDDVTLTFPTAHPAIVNNGFDVYWNGLKMNNPIDYQYTLASSKIVSVTMAVAPKSSEGDVLSFNYYY